MQVSGDEVERVVRKMVYCGIRSKALEIGRAKNTAYGSRTDVQKRDFGATDFITLNT